MDEYLVPIEQLKKKCDPSLFKGDTTEELPASRELIGQGRAMEAPKDWCYVFNFKRPKYPKAIGMKPGQGRIFKNEVKQAIRNIGLEIPKILTSKEYENNRNLLYTNHQKNAQKIINELNDLAKQYNFIFRLTEKGMMSIPLKEGKPMTDEELNNLPESEIEELVKISNELNQKAYDYIKRIKEVEDTYLRELKSLKEENVLKVLDDHLNILIEKYKYNQDICEYLEDMKVDIVKHYEMFMKDDEKKYLETFLSSTDRLEDFMKRYEVNLFIDNNGKTTAPVIREMNPTYYNLFGKIEYVNEFGVLKTDHMRIRPGSLHEANGGYIIIQVKDILQNPHAWEGLKRALTTEELVVENITGLNLISETLHPEAIPLDVKVIIIGDYYLYQLLYYYDDDFKKLFKIRAEFDIEMERNQENICKIGSFVAYQCKEEGLRPFDKTALAAIIEQSSRIAGNQNKLTAKFNELVEIIYEADLWAKMEGRDVVCKDDVKKAIEKKNYRNNSYEEKLIELIDKNIVMIDTEGEKIGEINGLSVIDSGQYAFGRPNKITVNTFAGKEGIINIEREVEQSGSIHDKGVLILGGYLGEKYAKDFPLTLTASITFEQSYSGIDGDSASSTELYALLSSLADVPIKQSIAVTGSVNQKGLVQPVGGINEKIEGFYKICKLNGLTGKEGVIMPYQNIENLMLDDEVIEAVEMGKFNIYAVKTIDEGIEILTGIKAGRPNNKGEYPKGTINYLVQQKLKRYYHMSKEEVIG